MKRILATAFCVWAGISMRASADPLLENAKKSQSESVRHQDQIQKRKELLKERIKDLARVMDQVVSEIEEKGVFFDGVQGDSKINPLPELIKGKVGFERHRKPARVILKPKGADERIYLEIVWTSSSPWGYAVRVSRGADLVEKGLDGDDLRSRESLERLAPRLKEAVLQLIAAK